jgi:glycosyltransferase involved in cell wall biosynthesis
MNTSRIRILIVMHGSGTGGVEKSLRTLCKCIDKSKFDILVALPSDGPLKTDLDNSGIRTVITPLDSWTPIQFHFGERHYYQFLSTLKERIALLANIIKDNHISIIHSSTLSVADGAFAARITGKPHVWHIHGKSIGTTDAYGSYLPIETLYRIVNSLSTKIVAVSEDVRQFLSRYISTDTIEVIYNGMDFHESDALRARPSSLKSEFNLDGKNIVMLVGRIASVKGIDDYIEAAKMVLEKRSNVAFLAVGSSDDEELSSRLKHRVRSLDLTDSIIFTGKRSDIPEILHEADVFVCSSRTEGLPYSCLEAMSASKPIVTTKCGGPEEMVINGETGFHVPVNRPEEIARSVISLIDNPALMKQMGEKSRECAEHKFSAEIFARKFEDLYLRILGSNTEDKHSPWDDVILEMMTNIGDMGSRMRILEHEVRDLRTFEALFKNNFIYKGMKKIFRK